ncbi:RusA family crossover junction endodeoxyribonuclease [Nocardia cyriacigeorgica]|uniref:RusA family crossover junction endodeoxyribonuclease n=1 Tax=Nocardia cyriacigeorgica TaxID=135487 RepID=UPI0024554A15|nr:RusA family crossover junction endodeoxyribonuclease [Nocardia cyriacigeorgica]
MTPLGSPLFIPGTPAPQGSKKHVGRGILVESSQAVGPWRERVALAVHQQGWQPLDGPVAVDLTFVMPRPKSTPKRWTPAAVKRPDIDKLARAILDAITGQAFADDSQVVELNLTKRLADPGCQPGVWITVADLTYNYLPVRRPEED